MLRDLIRKHRPRVIVERGEKLTSPPPQAAEPSLGKSAMGDAAEGEHAAPDWSWAMARGSRALHRHMKRPDEPDVRLDAPPEVSVPRSAQRRPRAPHRRCDSGESARSAAETLGATAVDAVNGPSRSGPRAAPSGDFRGHAGVSMASIALNFSRAVRAGARPLRAPAPIARSSACRPPGRWATRWPRLLSAVFSL